MFTVKFAEKEMKFDAPLSVFDAARAAEVGTRAHLAARVNGQVVDMTHLLDADADVQLLTFEYFHKPSTHQSGDSLER